MQSGHYFAYAKNSNGLWYRFDDETVKQVGRDHVLQQQAYVLFYEQVPLERSSPSKCPVSQAQTPQGVKRAAPGSSPLLAPQVTLQPQTPSSPLMMNELPKELPPLDLPPAA